VHSETKSRSGSRKQKVNENGNASKCCECLFDGKAFSKKREEKHSFEFSYL